MLDEGVPEWQVDEFNRYCTTLRNERNEKRIEELELKNKELVEILQNKLNDLGNAFCRQQEEIQALKEEVFGLKFRGIV